MTFKPGKYFSPGKLLISGEYIVLNGAQALAVPTRLGQTLDVSIINSKELHWEVLDHQGQTRFQSAWSSEGTVVSSSDESWNKIIEKTLRFLKSQGVELSGFALQFAVQFPAEWGLGSSSTLVANVAKATGVNAMELFQNTQTGSGYDVAVGMEESAILYSLIDNQPNWQRVEFLPPFLDQLFLVYLGQKQKSETEVKRFSERPAPKEEDISKVSGISSTMIHENDPIVFQKLIREHEERIASLIARTPVGESLFNDFPGSVKSLGAWGGDFILALADEGADAKDYFRKKGFEVVFEYTELVSS